MVATADLKSADCEVVPVRVRMPLPIYYKSPVLVEGN